MKCIEYKTIHSYKFLKALFKHNFWINVCYFFSWLLEWIKEQIPEGKVHFHTQQRHIQRAAGNISAGWCCSTPDQSHPGLDSIFTRPCLALRQRGLYFKTSQDHISQMSLYWFLFASYILYFMVCIGREESPGKLVHAQKKKKSVPLAGWKWQCGYSGFNWRVSGIYMLHILALVPLCITCIDLGLDLVWILCGLSNDFWSRLRWSWLQRWCSRDLKGFAA